MTGIGVSAFVAFCNAMEESHGGKLMDPDKVNEIIRLLGQAEAAYQTLPPDPNWKPRADDEGTDLDDG